MPGPQVLLHSDHSPTSQLLTHKGEACEEFTGSSGLRYRQTGGGQTGRQVPSQSGAGLQVTGLLLTGRSAAVVTKRV